MPNMYKSDIYSINYKLIKKMGIKCLLFDLDNTCVPYRVSESNSKLKSLFDKLKRMGFMVIIFSNSPRRRLEKFSDLGVLYNHTSMKPIKYNFNKIMKRYNYSNREVMIIGDQLFTDIYGGNRVGIYTCLVDPIDNVDMFFTKFTRLFENYEIKKLSRKNGFKRGNYYE